MKPLIVVGVLLVILGVISLAYQGITYTREKKVLDIGPIHATTQEKQRIPLPPVLGAVTIAGGVVCLIAGSRQKI